MTATFSFNSSAAQHSSPLINKKKTVAHLCGVAKLTLVLLLLYFQTFRHGFPYSPTSFAFDPVQKLLAIGDKSGYIRM